MSSNTCPVCEQREADTGVVVNSKGSDYLSVDEVVPEVATEDEFEEPGIDVITVSICDKCYREGAHIK